MLTTNSIDVLDINNFDVVETFRKKAYQDSKKNNIIKVENNNREEFLINVEKSHDNRVIIKLLDY